MVMGELIFWADILSRFEQILSVYIFSILAGIANESINQTWTFQICWLWRICEDDARINHNRSPSVFRDNFIPHNHIYLNYKTMVSDYQCISFETHISFEIDIYIVYLWTAELFISFKLKPPLDLYIPLSVSWNKKNFQLVSRKFIFNVNSALPCPMTISSFKSPNLWCFLSNPNLLWSLCLLWTINLLQAKDVVGSQLHPRRSVAAEKIIFFIFSGGGGLCSDRDTS